MQKHGLSDSTNAFRLLAGLVIGAAVAGCSGDQTLAENGRVSSLAQVVCLQQEAAHRADCRNKPLPAFASGHAYLLCIAENSKKISRCDQLREAYEAEVKAYLGGAAPPRRLAMPEPAKSVDPASARKLYHDAELLLAATTEDAEIFRHALGDPKLRGALEGVLRRKLDLGTLQRLAENSREEAHYWRAYMAGLDRNQGTGGLSGGRSTN